MKNETFKDCNLKRLRNKKKPIQVQRLESETKRIIFFAAV